MPRALQPRPSRLVAQLETPHFQQLGPALRTLTAAEQIARKRAITEAAIAARAGVSLSTVKSHLTRLRAGGFVRTRRLAHGLAIEIAPSPGRLFGVGNAGLGRLRGTGIVGPRPNGPATSHPAPAAQAAMLGAAGARDALILEHQPLVRRIARHCSRMLPYWLEVDDLISAGQLGLIAAADKFDPARGIPFAGFAYLLIRGAIIDANRRRNYDWELYDRLDGGDAAGDVAAEPAAGCGIDERLEREQLGALIDSAIAGLDERDRLACETYLGDGRTLKQLGDELGMSESGACLVRNKARARLREILVEMGVDGRELD